MYVAKMPAACFLFASPQVPRQYRGNQVGCPDPFEPGGESNSLPGNRYLREREASSQHGREHC